jgi:hypothetical protein
MYSSGQPHLDAYDIASLLVRMMIVLDRQKMPKDTIGVRMRGATMDTLRLVLRDWEAEAGPAFTAEYAEFKGGLMMLKPDVNDMPTLMKSVAYREYLRSQM